MNPMIDFVRGRTIDLQRVADDVRRERELRTTAPTAAAVTAAPRLLEPVAHTEATCPPCDPIGSAAPAKHAA